MRDPKEIEQMRVVYQLPHMEKVPVSKDIVYKTVHEEDLKMDVYYPPNMPSHSPCPAVLLVHGGSQPEHVEYIKESGQYVSWGQLIAASGLIAVMFKHRTDKGYTQLHEASCDIDDLIYYIWKHSSSLRIDGDRLCICAFSQGPIYGFRAVLRDTPTYIRCIVSYYGGMSIMDTRYFHFNADEEDLVRDFSPVYHLRHADASKVAPIFIVKAGRDRTFLNKSIEEFVAVASECNIPFTYMNHPTGEHGFDIFNNDARTREIIKATLAFLAEHLEVPSL
jgi:acetyl esterase/lipase